MDVIREDLSIERFIDLFLAALVVRGKRSIWVRTDAARTERLRMHALCEHIDKEVDRVRTSGDKEYLYFIVRLRNHVAPSNIGSFDNLEGSILRKMSTIVSVDLMWCHTYDIDLSVTTATSWLERSSERMRTLAEAAADKYMEPLIRLD